MPALWRVGQLFHEIVKIPIDSIEGKTNAIDNGFENVKSRKCRWFRRSSL